MKHAIPRCKSFLCGCKKNVKSAAESTSLPVSTIIKSVLSHDWYLYHLRAYAHPWADNGNGTGLDGVEYFLVGYDSFFYSGLYFSLWCIYIVALGQFLTTRLDV